MNELFAKISCFNQSPTPTMAARVQSVGCAVSVCLFRRHRNAIKAQVVPVASPIQQNMQLLGNLLPREFRKNRTKNVQMGVALFIPI